MQKIEEWDDKLQLIYAKFFAKEFKDIILKGYIYFIDNELFKDCARAQYPLKQRVIIY